ncbi:hypothetical protein QTI33_34320 [Variovorax sp. J22P271]|uniref:hypothetical protein n=1 Tax=Variovorax davisae TaxID=3053515 RepID=UPI002574BC90|nr:hypothetical protein [Variovorax sp. J22P271]MDM0037245.1 hypothetical protein [Variovorax sp. J22P271]
MKRSHNQIVDRFLSSEAVFQGITTLDEFRGCLKGFDEVIFPQRERLPLVSQFVDDPEFSLQAHAATMWTTFQEIWNEIRVDKSDSITVPMHHVAAATTTFLTTLANTDKEIAVVAPEFATLAVEQCGYYEFVYTKNGEGVVAGVKMNGKEEKKGQRKEKSNVE